MSVPRAVWPSKPGSVEPLDVYVERYYGLPIVDTAISPVALGYIEAGLPGVVMTHMLLGCLLAWAASQFVSRRGTIWPVFYAFLLAQTLNVELELFFEIPAAVKATVITAFVGALIRRLRVRGGYSLAAKSARFVKG